MRLRTPHRRTRLVPKAMLLQHVPITRSRRQRRRRMQHMHTLSLSLTCILPRYLRLLIAPPSSSSSVLQRRRIIVGVIESAARVLRFVRLLGHDLVDLGVDSLAQLERLLDEVAHLPGSSNTMHMRAEWELGKDKEEEREWHRSSIAMCRAEGWKLYEASRMGSGRSRSCPCSWWRRRIPRLSCFWLC